MIGISEGRIVSGSLTGQLFKVLNNNSLTFSERVARLCGEQTMQASKDACELTRKEAEKASKQ